jgi:hypothetical protein
MKKALILSLFVLLAGCAQINSQIVPNENFLDYKTAYLEIKTKDEFNLASEIGYQLSQMGMEVITKEKSSAASKSLLVKFTYDEGWDFAGYYLKSFQVFFTNADSEKIIASISYHKPGSAGPRGQERIVDAFNDFRKKLGLKELPGGS